MRRITRRQFLIGGAGLVGAAAGGVALADTDVGRRALHRVQLVRSPDHSPRRASLETDSGAIASEAMGHSVRWRLAMPADLEPPLPLVVCLHGRGADENYAMDTIRLPDMVAEVGASLAIASVDGDSDSYWHRRADGRDPEAMVIGELLPLLRERLGEAPVGLMGWSMGGYGALLLAGRHPGVVSAVVASSPATWERFGDSSPGAFDSAADFERHSLRHLLEQLRAMDVRIDCGEDDPFIETATELRSSLRANGRNSPGFHDAPYWRSVASAQVTFLSQSLHAS